jgi:toxin ParE1/3/4
VNPEVSKSPQAFRDLDDIAAYIGLDNPQAALRFLDSLENRFHLLAASPGIGRLRPDLGTGIQGFPVDDYVIFYRQLAAGIEVVRVLHGARDIDNLFSNDPS